jgi:fatty acid-binding protein DegV
VERCEEYVFLDRLQYLAAGGRLSKSGAFFGDMLGMKPIISPLADGARKAGVVRDRAGQLRFALDKLKEGLNGQGKALIMIEYTDNAPWVTDTVQPEIARRYPGAEILIRPMSLTAGAHMGPGTWAVAFLP